MAHVEVVALDFVYLENLKKPNSAMRHGGVIRN